jgi:hypothetical protein
MSKMMNHILESIENGTIEITKDGFKRVKHNTLSVESMRKRLNLNEDAIRVVTEEFTAEELLEMKGEHQTHLDLEAERLGRSLIFHGNDEIGV